jgi:hypothetical protein
MLHMQRQPSFGERDQPSKYFDGCWSYIF